MEQQTPPSPTEESIFNEVDYSMEGYDKHVRNARITLYVVAVLFLLTLFALPPMEEGAKYITIGLTVFISLTFAPLGFWSRKKPFTAILTALIVFATFQVLNAVLDPSTILAL